MLAKLQKLLLIDAMFLLVDIFLFFKFAIINVENLKNYNINWKNLQKPYTLLISAKTRMVLLACLFTTL
jgi:hypothetical protein